MNYLYFFFVVLPLIFLSPTQLYAVDDCEAELTNESTADPVVIMTNDWEGCKKDKPEECVTKSNFHPNEPRLNSSFATRCNGKALLGQNGWMSKDHGLGSVVGSTQMVFFAPNMAPSSDAEVQSAADKINYKHPDWELTDIMDGLIAENYLKMWDKSPFMIDTPATIDTTGRAVYVMGHPFYVPPECMGMNCDSKAYEMAFSFDWVSALYEELRSSTHGGGMTFIGCSAYQRIFLYTMLRAKRSFIGMGNNWTWGNGCDYDFDPIELKILGPSGQGEIWSPDVTQYKKQIKLDNILTVQGDGILVLKNVHIKVGPEGGFSIEGKARLVISESIIENDPESETPLFTFKNTEYGNKAFSQVLLDIIPENAAPLMLYYSIIKGDGAKIEVVGTNVSKLIMYDWETETYNPWGLSPTSKYSFVMDGEDGSNTVKCVRKSVLSCLMPNISQNEKLMWREDEDKTFLNLRDVAMDAYGFNMHPNEIVLILRSDRNYVIASKDGKTFRPVVIETPIVTVVTGRDKIEPWERLCSDTKGEFKLCCDGNGYGGLTNINNSCECVQATYEIDKTKKICVPTAKTITDNPTIESNDPAKDDLYIDQATETVQRCPENSMPAVDKMSCIDCKYYEVEPAFFPGVCMPIFNSGYKDHKYVDHKKVECVEDEVPLSDASYPTECVKCEGTEKEVDRGVCTPLIAECNAKGMKAEVHDCKPCELSTSVIVNNACKSCPSGTHKEGYQCVENSVDIKSRDPNGGTGRAEEIDPYLRTIIDQDGSDNDQQENNDNNGLIVGANVNTKSGCSIAGGGAVQLANIFQYIILLAGVAILKRRNYKS